MRALWPFALLAAACLVPDDAAAGWRAAQAICFAAGFAGGLAFLWRYSSGSGLKYRASLKSSTYVSWWNRRSSPMKPR